MEPQEFVKQELEIIHTIFAVQKEIYPMVVLIKDDNRYQVPVNYQNTAHKEIVSQGIKDLVKKSEPDVVVYVAEAWAKIIRDKYDRAPIGIASYDPDKTELVVVQIEFKTGEKFGCEARIFTEDTTRRLGKFEIIASDLSMGRFVDFFPVKRYN